MAEDTFDALGAYVIKESRARAERRLIDLRKAITKAVQSALPSAWEGHPHHYNAMRTAACKGGPIDADDEKLLRDLQAVEAATVTREIVEATKSLRVFVERGEEGSDQ